MRTRRKLADNAIARVKLAEAIEVPVVPRLMPTTSPREDGPLLPSRAAAGRHIR